MTKRGRKTRFTLELAETIYFLAKKGMTDTEIAYVVKIDESTLNRWKASPTFYNSLKKNKQAVDDQVEEALLKKALGYKYTEKTQERIHTGNKDGQPVYKTNQKVVEKEMPPSDSSCQFWLRNRRGDKWRDKIMGVGVQNNTQINATFNVDQTVNMIKNEYGDKAEIIAQQIADIIGIPMANGIAKVTE